MTDELRKEIRQLIWKTFIDARIKTLEKKKEGKGGVIRKQEVTGSDDEILSVADEVERMIEAIKTHIRSFPDIIQELRSEKIDVEGVATKLDNIETDLTNFVGDVEKLVDAVKGRLGVLRRK